MGQATFFDYAIIFQAVFSLFITLMIYTVPTSDLTYIYELKGTPTYQNIDSFGGEFQNNIQQQRSFGVVELGALALVSGNILLDLILNFFTAIPGAAMIIVNVVLIFLNISYPIKAAILQFAFAIIGIIYLILIITLILSLRTQSVGSL